MSMHQGSIKGLVLLMLVGLSMGSWGVAQDAMRDVTFGASFEYGVDSDRPSHLSVDAMLMLGNGGVGGDGELAARIDAGLPIDFTWFPSFGAGFVWLQPLGPVTLISGVGVDVRWYEVDGVRCYETVPRLTMGVDVPFDDSWSMRAEGLALPSLGRYGVRVGVAYSLP